MTIACVDDELDTLAALPLALHPAPTNNAWLLGRAARRVQEFHERSWLRHDCGADPRPMVTPAIKFHP